MKTKIKKFKCCICKKNCEGYGNNPYPLVKDSSARCCDKCNQLVIEARLKDLFKGGQK